MRRFGLVIPQRAPQEHPRASPDDRHSQHDERRANVHSSRLTNPQRELEQSRTRPHLRHRLSRRLYRGPLEGRANTSDT
jgi:hypothetical protein